MGLVDLIVFIIVCIMRECVCVLLLIVGTLVFGQLYAMASARL